MTPSGLFETRVTSIGIFMLSHASHARESGTAPSSTPYVSTAVVDKIVYEIRVEKYARNDK